MIIGADVSHAAPGLEQASMAAMTVSLDKTCSRYGAAVESNGKRVEMIMKENIFDMLTPLVDWWVKNIGQGQLPKHVYYFRDGVSEGQYTNLLKCEVADIKDVMSKLGNEHPDRMVSLCRKNFTIKLILYSQNSLLSLQRSVIIFASSLLPDQMQIRTAILSRVPLLIEMSRIRSTTISTSALMLRSRGQLVPRTIRYSWMR